MKKDIVEVAVQVNGKVPARLEILQSMPKEEIQALALADEKVKAAIGAQEVKKVIVIPGRLVNIVAK